MQSASSCVILHLAEQVRLLLLLLLGIARGKAGVHDISLERTSKKVEISPMGLGEKGRWVKVHSAFHHSL